MACTTGRYLLRERKLFAKYKYQDTPVFTDSDITESLLADENGAPPTVDSGPWGVN